MSTYYHRRRSDGEIVNASERSLPLPEVERRWPLDDDHFYDPHPPIDVLKRYRYWDERP